VLVDADQTVELGTDSRLVGDLDEEGRRELVLPRHQLVVDVDLLLDPGGVVDALDPGHLLDLEAQRLVVLEDQRDLLAHRQAPVPLVRDHGCAIPVAQPGVGVQVDDLVAGDGPHAPPSP
jgi:hypothetical protein